VKLKSNYKNKEFIDAQGKVKFSVLKKKGKHKRGKDNRDIK
tara:strand:- start:880 stop:1002 length:123 start_codon:yes stop_codon:yes gene_type:complete